MLELDVNKPEDLERAAPTSCASAGAASTASCTRSPSRPRTRSAATSSTRRRRARSTAFQTSAFSLKALAVALADLYPPEGASDRRPRLRRHGRLAGLRLDGRGQGRARGDLALPGPRPRPARRARQPRLGRPARHDRRARHPGLRATSPTAWERQAPLGWDTSDPAPVGGAVCFLLSRLARAITGEILHVDGGFHAMGTALDPGAAAADGPSPNGQVAAVEGACVSQPPVLLTGATGFLGMEVLARLLERGDRDVVCLVRADDDGARPRSASTACWTRSGTTRRRYRGRVRARRRRRHRAGPRACGPARAPSSPRRSARCCTAPRRSPSTSRSRRRALINVEGTREVIGFAREAKALGRLRALRPRLDRLRRRAPPRRLPRAPARRRPGLPQHLRADQVGGRARARRRRRPRARRRAAEHRHGRRALGLDAGLQRPLLAAARVLARAVRPRAGAAGRPRRRGHGRLRRRRAGRAARPPRGRGLQPRVGLGGRHRARPRSTSAASASAARRRGSSRRARRGPSSPRVPRSVLPALLRGRDGVRRRAHERAAALDRIRPAGCRTASAR